MNKIIIFGNRDFAELAHYYISNDTNYTVAAFCVSGEYLKEESFNGKPIVAFEEIQTAFPSHEFKFFAPLSPTDMNKQRADIYEMIIGKGYNFISYISSKATIHNN